MTKDSREISVRYLLPERYYPQMLDAKNSGDSSWIRKLLGVSRMVDVKID